MDEKMYWTQRDGTPIKYEDMEVSHIINSIKMLERNATKLKDKIILDNIANSSFVSSEHAEDAIDHENRMLENMSASELLSDHNSYRRLKEELAKREGRTNEN